MQILLNLLPQIGSEAIEYILKNIDLEKLAVSLREQLFADPSQQRRLEIVKRLKIVEGFRAQNKKSRKSSRVDGDAYTACDST